MTFFDVHFITMLNESFNNRGKAVYDPITKMMHIAEKKNNNVDQFTKNIDITGMKCVIIPAHVNDNHWVLYVLMNPCSIFSALQLNDATYEGEVDKRDGAPLLLYFDSMKKKKKKTKPLYIGKIYDWIFGLCMKNNQFEGYVEQLKDKKKYRQLLPVINVKGANQDNTYDCGLFVCRNAYNILTSCLNDFNVSFQDIEDYAGEYASLIFEKYGKQWNYNQDDIDIFRTEMRTLYATMSAVAIKPVRYNTDVETEKNLEPKAVEESTKNANTNINPPAENKNDPASQDAFYSCMINDKRTSAVMRDFTQQLNPILCNAVGLEFGVDTSDCELDEICTNIGVTVS